MTEFRAVIDEDSYLILHQIKSSKPNIKNNTDILEYLIANYQNKSNGLIQELRNLKIEQATTNEALGELMAQSTGFRKANDSLPISEMIFGSDFIGIQKARKAALEKVAAGREKKFDGKKKSKLS